MYLYLLTYLLTYLASELEMDAQAIDAVVFAG